MGRAWRFAGAHRALAPLRAESFAALQEQMLRRLLLEDGYDVTTRVHPLPEGELELVLLLERLDGA